MSTETRTRTRNRKLDIDPIKVSPRDALNHLAIEYYTNNREMNARKGKADKARKSLYSGMKELNLQSFSTSFQEPDAARPVTLDVTIETPTGQAVDVRKLRSLVTEDQFYAIISASAAAVTEAVGTSILNQVLVPSVGTENVKVRAAK